MTFFYKYAFPHKKLFCNISVYGVESSEREVYMKTGLEKQDGKVNHVRLHRHALFMTQKELARRAEVSPRTIHSIENGRGCRRHIKRKVLNGLGLPFADVDLVFPPQ